MMSSIITGLFSSQGQSAQIAADLENAGFNYSDYVMYLHEKPIKKEIKGSRSTMLMMQFAIKVEKYANTA